jgi:DNA-binding NtrC family response regulator
VEVLRREAANKSRAARALGIDRRKLYRLLEKYQITDGEIAAASDGNTHAGMPPASGPVSG